jgi:hypothetical protein
MLALGLTVDLPTPKRPVLRAVLLSDPYDGSQTPSLGEISTSEVFDVPAFDEDWAIFCRDFAETVSGRTRTLKPDIVVVRRADIGKTASNRDGPRIRLVATGAVTAAARILVQKTHLRTGAACGQVCGKSKPDLDAEAGTLVSKAAQVPAAAAALSGLLADRQ